jgi:hypothetical protein
MVVVHVMGSMQDKRAFSSLSFLKNKLQNSLDPHLKLLIAMYSQCLFSLKSFSYDACFTKWLDPCERNRYGVMA